jgi:hypothetical protein
MHADHSARRDGSSHTTIPSILLLIIREHLRESAAMLFGKILRATALPRINTNARRSPGTARRIVAHDHPINIFSGHLRAFA